MELWYSKIPLLRPPFGLPKSGLIREVLLILNISYGKYHLEKEKYGLNSEVVLILGGLNSDILLYLISPYHLMMLYICTQFQENISEGFRVIERMQFAY